jgi:serine phosphatase RsbU (regulator of sigma subunit)
MCDAVGHGLPSALFAARINTFALTHALKERDPCKLTSLLNEHLCQGLSGLGMFASFSSAHFDFENQTVDFAGAAHPPAIHYRKKSHSIELLPSETTLLGIAHPLPLACGTHRRQTEPGDRIVLYTDGLTEAKNSRGELYGIERLQAFTMVNLELQASAFNEALISQVMDHGGGELSDDILVMSIILK